MSVEFDFINQWKKKDRLVFGFNPISIGFYNVYGYVIIHFILLGFEFVIRFDTKVEFED